MRHDNVHGKVTTGLLSIVSSATKLSEILIKITNFSFTKNASENIVCETATIFCRGRWVKDTQYFSFVLGNLYQCHYGSMAASNKSTDVFSCLYHSHWIQECQPYHQTTTNHFLNQFWLVMHMVLLHSPDTSLPVSAQATVLYNEFELYTFKMIDTSPWGQWVNMGQILLILFDVSIISFFMMTSWNGNINCVTAGPLWGESTAHQCIPLKKATDAELWRFFYLGLNKRLDKQMRCQCFEMPPPWL